MVKHQKLSKYYANDRRKKNWDFISNLITWNLSDKSVITHKKSRPSLRKTKDKSISWKLIRTFNVFLFFCVWSLKEVNCDFFSHIFSIKIYRCVPCGYRVVPDSVSFWDAENSKGLSWTSFSYETCFCSQQMFCPRCLRSISKDNEKPFRVQKSTEIHCPI